MIEEKYSNIIVCPICKKKVTIKKNALNCDNCKHTYYIQEDIPQMLSGNLNIDAILSREKWGLLYDKNELKRDYRNDKTTISVYEFIIKYKHLFSKGIFLDLGCGITWNGAFLAKDGISLLGTDISYEGLYKSKLLFLREKLKGCFVQASFTNLPFKDNSIQFIYAGLSVLEYEKNPKSALLESYRVLKPGGRMVATFPVASFTTLTYQQLRGDIPNIPFVKFLAEFIHIKMFKGKYLKYGYGQTSFIGSIKKSLRETPFQLLDIGYFDIYYPVQFAPRVIKPFIRKILRFRPFWPIAYVEIMKPAGNNKV